MTCYNCDKCGRYEHISKFGEFEIIFEIRNLEIEKTIRLCKWCMTKNKIKYKVVNNWTEVSPSHRKIQ